jgi:signal transduction histidine kinase
MSRLPIRVRLTAAFTLAVVVVIAGAAFFVYARLASDLDDAINDALAVRADASESSADAGSPGLDAETGAPPDSEDGLAQVIDPSGRLIDDAGGGTQPVLTPGEALAASRAKSETFLERRIAAIDGTTRLLARPVQSGGQAAVLVVGQSLEDRNETLGNLARSFAIGGPIAVLIVSFLGYALATAGLAPIEAMRRRAGAISLAGDGDLLPLPVARDEVHRLGTTLNQMLGRLRASFERERRFVADASHELRTPIAVIKTELEGALRSGQLGPDAREAITSAVEECDSLAALAEDLLVIARAAEGDLPVSPVWMKAASLLGGVRDRFADRAESRGRTIRIEVQGDRDVQVFADPERLRQALSNLVDNALRHGNGEIVLTARADPECVELEVRDAGDGFDPSLEHKAFDRFSRGADARGRAGSGLGLAIVRTIAQAHGGEAAIGDGSGTAVCIRLPSP